MASSGCCCRSSLRAPGVSQEHRLLHCTCLLGDCKDQLNTKCISTFPIQCEYRVTGSKPKCNIGGLHFLGCRAQYSKESLSAPNMLLMTMARNCAVRMLIRSHVSSLTCAGFSLTISTYI